jgi:PII-like signaling protein
MRSMNVTMVKIYITEASKLLKPIVNYLHNEVKVRGVSVFRAVSGYGESGNHLAALVDLSLDLPLSIEFFDEPEKVRQALDHLGSLVKSEHIVFWPAQANDKE